MTIGRRPVLQGLAATGLAAVAPGFPGPRADVYAKPNEKGTEGAVPWIAALSATGFSDDFLEGLALARAPGADLAVLRIDNFGSADLVRLQAMLTAGQRQTLVGLVDDGLAAIIIESARAAGARLRWMGQHTLTPTGARHRLLTASDGYAARFTEALIACESHISISCQDLSGSPRAQLSASSAVPATPDPDPVRWAFALGQIIAMAHRREPLPPGELSLKAAGRPQPSSSRLPESLVSFSCAL